MATTSPTEDGTSGPGVATTITNFIGEDIIDGDLITVQIGDGEINKRTLKIIVILATFSFTVTILAIVTVCVSVVCVKKHANKHKCANGEEKHSNTEAGLDSSTPIGSGTLLHNNSAYNRTSNIAQSIINREEWLPSNASTYYYVSQSETYEEIDSSSDSEGYEKVSMQQSRNENCNSMVGCVIYSKSNSDREPLDSSTEAYNSVTGTRSELHRYDADTVYVDPENEADAIRDSSEDTKMSTNIAYNGRSIVAHETDTDTTTDQQERNLDHDECHYEHIL